MINLRQIFNTNNNIIFIAITIILFIILLTSTKDLKHIGNILIKTSIFLIIISFLIPTIINVLNNNIIKIFINPIIDNIKTKIITTSIILIIIGYIFTKIEKRIRT